MNGEAVFNELSVPPRDDGEIREGSGD